MSSADPYPLKAGVAYNTRKITTASKHSESHLEVNPAFLTDSEDGTIGCRYVLHNQHAY